MKIKKKIFFLLLPLLFAFSSLQAQNLVLNPSFEDTVHCPTGPSQLYNTKFWITPTTASPDYFNVCSVGAHVPNNALGNQSAHSGVAYAGFYAYNTVCKNYKEYIQAPLSNTLTTNHKYFVSFYVSLAEVSQYAVSSIGAYFSSIPVTSTNSVTLNYVAQIQNPSSHILSDKTNWMLISDTLYAEGSEQYITIGNFKADSLSDTLYLGFSSSNNVAYYYIDDISVVDYGPTGIETHKGIKQVNIYPNPTSNTISLNIENISYYQNSTVTIQNTLGQTIKSLPFTKNIDVSELPEGCYFLQIILSNGETYKGKFVKQ